MTVSWQNEILLLGGEREGSCPVVRYLTDATR